MAKGDLKKFIKRRPSWFWWTLLNLLAAAFAVASWSVCLYIFSFPERPSNYEFLRKLNRLAPVVSYDPLEAPDGIGANEQELLEKFYALDPNQLGAHNRQFKRNYLTNFRKPEVVYYATGTYQVTHNRPLTKTDFFHPGLAVRAQAIVQTDERAEPSLYPVILELLLPGPTSARPTGVESSSGGPSLDPALFPVGHTFELKKFDHRALILHAARLGTDNDPVICLTVVPIVFPNYLSPDGKALPLHNPDPLNLSASFPAMAENRKE